ncbi:hypothetical protein ACU5AX_09250 [Sphingomonas sp. XXL09]|uniref:hypothetical protein n=1 Tax=Sphingomonas sp. XXL09 TaxID=3457787 RepID=UPI00406BDB4C
MTLSPFELVLIAAVIGLLLITALTFALLYYAAMAENADLRRKARLFAIGSPLSTEARTWPRNGEREGA